MRTFRKAAFAWTPRSTSSLGNDVVVTLAGLHAAAGVVKWKDHAFHGIGFNRVFPVDELMGFLKEQQRNQQEQELEQRRAVG